MREGGEEESMAPCLLPLTSLILPLVTQRTMWVCPGLAPTLRLNSQEEIFRGVWIRDSLLVLGLSLENAGMARGSRAILGGLST